MFLRFYLYVTNDDGWKVPLYHCEPLDVRISPEKIRSDKSNAISRYLALLHFAESTRLRQNSRNVLHQSLGRVIAVPLAISAKYLIESSLP